MLTFENLLTLIFLLFHVAAASFCVGSVFQTKIPVSGKLGIDAESQGTNKHRVATTQYPNAYKNHDNAPQQKNYLLNNGKKGILRLYRTFQRINITI